jgi:hypothetical protein
MKLREMMEAREMVEPREIWARRQRQELIHVPILLSPVDAQHRRNLLRTRPAQLACFSLILARVLVKI